MYMLLAVVALLYFKHRILFADFAILSSSAKSWQCIRETGGQN